MDQNSMRRGMKVATLLAVLLAIASPLSLHAGDKKKKDAGAAKQEVPVWNQIDFSKIVWPNPPAITRVRYVDFFSAEKVQQIKEEKKKAGWMDRLSGVAAGEGASGNAKPRFQLASPYGLAVDSKGNLYVADEKVGAVFIFNTETKDLELIKHGVNAKFALITGLAIDDSDRLFVSDSVLKHVLVFDAKHNREGVIGQGKLVSPAGIAVDDENRFLYVADSEADQVFVFDCDPPYNLIRVMGHGGPNSKHELTTPGDFSRPTNVAVDADRNLYVSDTFNDRVEIFDAEGNFISTFGKAGDGPGYFARPKGIAIDKDGHVWVADSVQDRIQVFEPSGRVLLWMGGHGLLPGQFSSLVGLAVDKNNRVFASEQYYGRVQMFRYTPNADAIAEKKRRDDEIAAKKKGNSAAQSSAQAKPGEANAKDSAAK